MNSSDGITVQAPAKINLTLEVTGKRPDGFHNIRSVIQAVDLCDYLTVRSAPDISVTCNVPWWSVEQSLVGRAIALMREAAGGSRGAVVTIEKHIPLMSGLGGDSSDAAAVLKALDTLWGTGLTEEKLREMAGGLGSDVFFFLDSGTALVEGRGEIIRPLPSPQPWWLLLAMPDGPVSPGKTAAMYARLTRAHYTKGAFTDKVAAAMEAGKRPEPSMLFNVFQHIAFGDFDRCWVYAERLVSLGAPRVHLAGSGPALFTLFEDRAAAEELYNRCREEGMEVYLARTL